MSFLPNFNDVLMIDDVTYHIAEHPTAPGMPYGQEGRQAVVYQLADGNERRALKVFKPRFRVPALVALTAEIVKYADLPGLAVCHRNILTQQRNSKLLEQYPDLQFAVLMPWIEGPTWMEVMLTKDDPVWDSFAPKHSAALATTFAQILAEMEQRGIAHCDLSASNVLLPALVESPDPNASAIELVDVEELYAANLSKPNALPSGSDGYAHKTAVSGLWSADADRFAGAVLLAEILGWCDARVRRAAYGEQFFDPSEMQRDTERYRLLRMVLKEHWGDQIAETFERAWQSRQLSDCPPLAEWTTCLSAQTAGTRVSVRAAAALFKLRRGSKSVRVDQGITQLDTDDRIAPGEEGIALAQESVAHSAQREQDGDLGGAVADMRRALDLAPRGSALKQELAIALTELVNRQERMAALNPLVVQAKGFENAGQWTQAAMLYQELVNRAPTSLHQVEWQQDYERCAREAELDALFEQGQMAFQQSRWGAAEEILTEVVRRRPRFARNGVQAAVLLAQVVAARAPHSARPSWQQPMFVGTIGTVALVVLVACISLIALRNPTVLNLLGLAASQTETPTVVDTKIAVAFTLTPEVPIIQAPVVQPVVAPKIVPTANSSTSRNPTLPLSTAVPIVPANTQPPPTASNTPTWTLVPTVTSTPSPSTTSCPGAPVITSFYASPSSITAGGSTNLIWSVSNATSVSIDNGIGSVGLSGSRSASPSSTTTFTLSAIGCGGSNSSQAQVVVSALPPSIAYFNTSSSQITAGSSATLSWSVSNATTVSIDNGIGSVSLSGNRSVNPANTTTYTLFASGSGGNTSRQVQVVVIPCPVPSISYFSASPSSITAGSSTTLSWSVSNATTVVIDGFGSVASTGSRSMTLSGNATIFLNAYGCGGNVNRQVQVFIITPTVCPAPSISYFTASPNLITAGSSTTLNWSVSNANSVSIDGGIGTVATLGSRSVSPGGTTTFTLTASGCGGNQTRQTMVTVAPRTNDITGFSVTEISTREIQVSVNYSYNGDHGTNNIFIEAWPQDYRGIDATGVGYTPGGPISIGTGSTVNRVILSGPMPSFSTTQMKMCMYVGGSKEFFCRTFQYSKTWSW